MFNINDFESNIKDLIVFFEEMSDVEKEKLKAVTENNILLLEECMNKEQANILRLRGLDKKREQIQSALSFEKLSFKEIIQLLPEENKTEMNALLNELSLAVSLYKKYSENAKTAIEVNLHSIDHILEHMKHQKNIKNTVYHPLKNKNGIYSNKSITNRKI